MGAMMTKNVSGIDRIARILLGLALLVGFFPEFGISTCPRSK
ncbi:MAG: DUF2892 domain-containing protein [Rhodobacterales bacterium]